MKSFKLFDLVQLLEPISIHGDFTNALEQYTTVPEGTTGKIVEVLEEDQAYLVELWGHWIRCQDNQRLEQAKPDFQDKFRETLGVEIIYAHQLKIVEELAFIGTETVVSALERTLEDHDGEVRQAAAEALRQIGTESGLALLTQKLPESSGLFHDAAEPVPPLSSLIGTLHLETTDLAENHDRYLAESLEREMQSGE